MFIVIDADITRFSNKQLQKKIVAVVNNEVSQHLDPVLFDLLSCGFKTYCPLLTLCAISSKSICRSSYNSACRTEWNSDKSHYVSNRSFTSKTNWSNSGRQITCHGRCDERASVPSWRYLLCILGGSFEDVSMVQQALANKLILRQDN